MHRSVLPVCLLLCLSACLPSPNAPALIETPVTGEWVGTMESSWGVFELRASLENVRYTYAIQGTYTLDVGRATGTIYGTLETREVSVNNGARSEVVAFPFRGSLTISYPVSGTQPCRSSGTFGPAIGFSHPASTLAWESEGFSLGNCPDAPRAVRIILRRA